MQRVVAHLGQKWHAGCPMCGTKRWELSGHVTLTLSDAPGAMVIGGPVLPCIAAVCQNCGNTVLVNLVAAKLLGPPNG